MPWSGTARRSRPSSSGAPGTVRQLTGGVFRLRCFRIGMMWHPFSIAGAVETADGPVALIHVFDARDGKEGTWTNALCRLAASAPFVELECRGPIIAPLFTAKGPGGGARPTVADRRGGVGLAPAVAFLRLVRLSNPVPNQIRFVAIVRSAQQIEVLDALCLPTAGAATQVPWLQTEIHVTRRKTAPTLEGSPSMPRHGRVSIRADTGRKFGGRADALADNILHDTKNPLEWRRRRGGGQRGAARVRPGAAGAPRHRRRRRRARGGLLLHLFSYVVLAREDAPFARESAYFFDDSKRATRTRSPAACRSSCARSRPSRAPTALYSICAWVRRRRSLEEDAVAPKDVELRESRRRRGAPRSVWRRRARARPRRGRGAPTRRRAARRGRWLRSRGGQGAVRASAGGPDVLRRS